MSIFNNNSNHKLLVEHFNKQITKIYSSDHMNKEMYMQVVWFKTILFYSADLNKISLMPISYLTDEQNEQNKKPHIKSNFFVDLK